MERMGKRRPQQTVNSQLVSWVTTGSHYATLAGLVVNERATLRVLGNITVSSEMHDVAVLVARAEGEWRASVPDFPDCRAAGATADETLPDSRRNVIAQCAMVDEADLPRPRTVRSALGSVRGIDWARSDSRYDEYFLHAGNWVWRRVAWACRAINSALAFPSVVVFKPDDVVLAEIAAGLYFNEM